MRDMDIEDLFRILDRLFNNAQSSYNSYSVPAYNGIEMLEDDKYVYITVDFGITVDSVRVEAKESKIILKLKSGINTYEEILNIDIKIKENTLEYIFNNGILDIKIEKEEITKKDDKI